MSFFDCVRKFSEFLRHVTCLFKILNLREREKGDVSETDRVITLTDLETGEWKRRINHLRLSNFRSAQLFQKAQF